MTRNIILYILLFFNFFIVDLSAENDLFANSEKYTKTTFSLVEKSISYSVSLTLSEKGVYLDLTQKDKRQFILYNDKIVTDKLQNKRDRYELFFLLGNENSALRTKLDKLVKDYLVSFDQEEKEIQQIKELKVRNKEYVAFIKRRESWITNFGKWEKYLAELKVTKGSFRFTENSIPYSCLLTLSENGVYLDLTQKDKHQFILYNNKIITDKLKSKEDRYKLFLLLGNERSILRKELDKRIKKYIVFFDQEEKKIQQVKDIKLKNEQYINFIKRKNSWTTGYAKWKSNLLLLKAKKTLYQRLLKNSSSSSSESKKNSHKKSKKYNVTIDNFPFDVFFKSFSGIDKTNELSVFQLINNMFSGLMWIFMLPFLFILGVLLIVLIIVVLLIINYRQNRMKYKMAMQALQTGRCLSERVVVDETTSFFISPQQALKNKGIKQMALGVGITLLLYFIFNLELASIGLLIFCIGLGKYIIAEQSIKKNNIISSMYNKQEKREDKKEDFSSKDNENSLSNKGSEDCK